MRFALCVQRLSASFLRVFTDQDKNSRDTQPVICIVLYSHTGRTRTGYFISIIVKHRAKFCNIFLFESALERWKFMSNVGSERVNLSLFNISSLYLTLGYSVIPVLGDKNPQQSKVCPVEWKPYQTRFATSQELKHWFEVKGYGGVAILTGRVSSLVVLDFDNADLAKYFAQRFPELTETYTVLSAGRKLPHYYYHLPHRFSIAGRALKGVDLQADGRYVVASPTSINGEKYTVTRAGKPLSLNSSLIDKLNKFLDSVELLTHSMPKVKSVSVPVVDVTQFTSHVTPSELTELYHRYAPEQGRNLTLFNLALKARDSGWQIQQAESVLVQLHIDSAKGRESKKERQHEALATIRSAYSRSPAKPKVQATGLATSLREKLLKLEQVAVLRVLDGLLLRSVPVGAVCTERDIVEVLDGVVGRYSILKALSAKFSDGTPFFEEVDPFPRPQTPTNVARPPDPTKEKQCFLFGVPASDKSMGRPPKYFKIPTVAFLCAKLGVKFTSSDPLSLQDLQSPAKYRQGMHREFLKRCPGDYYQQLLGRRLYVTKRTCQRYNRILGIRVIYNYDEFPVDRNLSYVHSFGGAGFLEDVFGKRYPAIKKVASRLLAEGKAPVMKVQRPNTFYHPEGQYPELPVAALEVEIAKNAQNLALQAQPTQLTKSAFEPQEIAVFTPCEAVPVATSNSNLPKFEKLKPYKPKRERYYRRQLPDDNNERWAMRLYQETRALVQQARRATQTSYFSLAKARLLADQYGATMIKRVLGLVSVRNNIQNYAGFIVDWLKTVQRTEHWEQYCNLSRVNA
jgi:hypothetical protein